MELQTRHYDISRLEVSPSWAEKTVVFFAITCFMFGFRWIIESLLHWKHQPVIETLIMPVVVGAWCAFTAFQGGSVIIGQNFIEGRTLIGRWTFKKRIGREEIKSISENRRGLKVMDRGGFARMLRFVFIPASLLKYQEIRSELALWAPVKVKS
ncbi:MAG TPA: hypothetical protein VGJ30_17570 [Candidatus Angelobacter sp.]|jgi:hypothetical protein